MSSSGVQSTEVLNINVSHDIIMAALSKPINRPLTLTQLTCVCISDRYQYSSILDDSDHFSDDSDDSDDDDWNFRRYSQHRSNSVQKMVKYLSKTYSPLLTKFNDRMFPSKSSTKLMFQPYVIAKIHLSTQSDPNPSIKEEVEVLCIESKLEDNKNSFALEGRISMSALFDKIIDQPPTDNLQRPTTAPQQSNFSPFFLDILHLGKVLKDTNITHLNLSCNEIKITNDYLLEFFEHLSGSRIVSLNLPRIAVVVNGQNEDSGRDIGSEYCERYRDSEYRERDETVTDEIKGGFSNHGLEDDNFGCLDSLYQLWRGCNKNDDNGISSAKLTSVPGMIDGKMNAIHYLGTILKDSEINSVDFGSNPIDLEILSSSLINSKISFLGLRGCKIQNYGLEQLAKILKDTHINSIDLSSNELNCKSLKLLAPGLKGTEITSLNLSCNRLGINGLVCLGKVLKKTKITTIDVSSNNLSSDCLRGFADYLVGSNVTSLNLRNNQIGKDDLKRLTDVLKGSKITSIDLGRNNLGCESMKILSLYLLCTNITTLCLSGIELFIDCLECLTSALRNSKVTSINLSRCGLCSKSMEVLAQFLKGSKVQSLILRNNNIDVDGIDSLANILKDTQITYLDLSFNGVKKISSNLFKCLDNTMIVTLIMEGIKIDYELLASKLIIKNSRITSIDVGRARNKKYDKGLNIFIASLVYSKITTLHLVVADDESIENLTAVIRKTPITSLSLDLDKRLTKYSIYCNNRLIELFLCLPETKVESLILNENCTCYSSFLTSILKFSKINSLNLGKWVDCSCFERNRLADLIHSNHSSDYFHMDGLHQCIFSMLYLMHHLKKTNIIHLKLTNYRINRVGYNFLKYLCPELLNSHIEVLNLSGNSIDCRSVYHLAKILKHTCIRSLNLSNNNIACDGLKYLIQGAVGSQIRSLKLCKNCINDDGVQYLAKNLENFTLGCFTRKNIIKIDLRGNYIGNQTVDQLSESVRQLKLEEECPTIQVYLGSSLCNLNQTFFINSDCPVNLCINQIHGGDIDGIEKLHIKKILFQEQGISNMIWQHEGHFEFEALDNVNITELRLLSHFDDEFITTIFSNSNIIVLRLDKWSDSSMVSKTNLILKVKVIALKIDMKAFIDLDKYDSGNFKLALINSNIVYLDLSGNGLGQFRMDILVEILRYSKIISLNLSNNQLEASGIELLADVLPDTSITYIDFDKNSIGYLGYRYLMNAFGNSRLCWLSLANNNIEEQLKGNIELSPYIVPRDDTPIEIQIRYLFGEMVSVDPDSETFEFIVPGLDSFITINHYPIFLKLLEEEPDYYKFHIYDYFYMQCKTHDIHLLNRINCFLEELKQKFSLFVEIEKFQLKERFGCDFFINLVEECERLKLTNFVKLLLLQRPLFYVDDEQNFLHPMIYTMLHKNDLPLYNENLEPNIKQKIIFFFQQHSDIDGAGELIHLLKKIE